jgi:hypothetical protein
MWDARAPQHKVTPMMVISTGLNMHPAIANQLARPTRP